VNVFVTGPVGANHSSVAFVTGGVPPAIIATLAVKPPPPPKSLLTPKSPTSAQLVPL
jgi:hypothetical protein